MFLCACPEVRDFRFYVFKIMNKILFPFAFNLINVLVLKSSVSSTKSCYSDNILTLFGELPDTGCLWWLYAWHLLCMLILKMQFQVVTNQVNCLL